jgi:tyrosyl-tRNA synthetase
MGQSPQVVLTMPILEGLDGVQKMSKSLGNYIGIAELPNEMFGKLMSVSDTLMWRYMELLSFRSLAEIEADRRAVAEGRNPRDVKVAFAQEIIARFHDRAAADAALADFELRFKAGAIPEDLPEVTLSLAGAPSIGVAQLLKQAGLVESTSEAFRQIAGGAVKLDGEKVSNREALVSGPATVVAQVGKRRFARVTLTP